MEKLFKFGNQSLNWLFNGFFFLTLFFAVTSPNIILGDNLKTGAGTTVFTAFCLIIIAAVIIGLITYQDFRDWTYQTFVVKKISIAGLLLGAVVVWQIIFVLNVHPPIGFDAGAIHDALSNTTSPEIIDYYSLNYNNVPILLAQHGLVTIFHTKSWLFVDLITLLFVDISALLNIFSVMIVDRKRIGAALYIHALWLALFPMIIVSYSDTWVLPMVSGYLFFYCVLSQKRFKLCVRGLAGIGFGVAVMAAYFMKPSAIIGAIAIALIEILFKLKKRKKETNKNVFLKLALPLVTVLALGISYFTLNQKITNQTYIASYSTRHIPAIHFISMGVSGDGGYNPKDALEMAKITTVKGRAEYSKKILVKRLKKMGMWGYIQFLFKKQRNNTADGTFAWVKEGHFINENPIPNTSGFAGTLRSFVYLYGKNLGDFRFLAQLWWIILLILIAFGWRDQRKISQVMRLTILGGFLYLLIFEGGRSRYLIQFLPAFLILATLVYDQTFDYFKRIYRWANGLND